MTATPFTDLQLRRRHPPHPGETLREDVLPALEISVTEMARRLGLARETLSRILHGRAPISPDLAVRLERAGIGRARAWLAVQCDYDLWQAEHRAQPPIESFAELV
ncbi:HigA family addiction module antitoxin [Halomonas urumqiensis]|uniref:Addiction module antidote protein, HigA family n=1 Tax=Halomonas urumqiensis TaxID=1684789 RepID=A0A2N7UKL3_9GAMM|nr:HigA family addiction module antitoxin [Halomonas urumqiensis]PMR80974.1 addiction module antidote protein, HigA family [Halomonas urumqiensis]PTB02952.1 addiction module antidote protein, HigA family [Halomonas urumqiensis]